MGQIFLLHHPNNHQAALQIADYLTQAGYQPILRLPAKTHPDAVLTLLSPDLLQDAGIHALFKQLRTQNISAIALKVAPVPAHIKGIDATENLSTGLEQVLQRLTKLNILPDISPAYSAIPWQYAAAMFVGFIGMMGLFMLLILPGFDSIAASEPMPTLSSFSVAEVTPEATEPPVIDVTETVTAIPEQTALPEVTPESDYDNVESDPIDVYFEPDPYEGIAPLTVSFLNDSYGDYERCEWDFDGDSVADSDECDPDAYIYENPGAYEITLMLFDADDNAYSYTDYVDVFVPEDADGEVSIEEPIIEIDTLPNTLPERPLTALFRASPMEGLAPLRVNFADLSRGAVVSYQWDVNGDGRPDSQDTTTTHTYNQRGEYAVTLTVDDDNGNQDTVDLTIFVYDESDAYEAPTKPPLARFNLSETIGEAPLTVNFKNLSQGYITAYNWDFDSNGSIDSTDHAPSYTFTQAGNYTVTLTVTNDRGEQDTRQSILTVKKPPAPLAGFTATAIEGEAPLVVQFMNTSEGDITTHAWDFDGDGVTDSTDANPLYTYTEPGDYEVTLTVSGAGGSSEPEYEYILVDAAQPPEVDFSMSVSSGIAPLSVAFTPASDKDVLTYAWDFNDDGTTDSTDANPTYIFTEPGAHEISLMATGKGGDSERVYHSVYVSPAAPTAQFVSSVQSGIAPLEVVFINTTTTTI
ncbi:MAG: PKD domain-containing protein, partial [Aggregatilineales bacterium]